MPEGLSGRDINELRMDGEQRMKDAALRRGGVNRYEVAEIDVQEAVVDGVRVGVEVVVSSQVVVLCPLWSGGWWPRQGCGDVVEEP